MRLKVKVKRLREDIAIPMYAKEGDAGFDLAAIEGVVIEPGETKIIKTGLAFEIPPGYEMQVRPRSGMSVKTRLRVIIGTVDSSYRGEVGVIAENAGNEPYEVEKGVRVAQGVVAPVETAWFLEVDELSSSERGNKGFGSTGVRS